MMTFGLNEHRLVRRWLFAFFAAGVAWRVVRFAVAMPIWGDEAMLGLNVIERSYAELLRPLANGQVSPIAFPWALRLTFDHFGISDYTARLPAVIAGTAALVLLWQSARLLLAPTAALIATGMAAVSTYMVRHAVELKPYAFDLFAAVLLLCLAAAYFQSRSVKWLVALIIVAPVCSVVSYPQIFVATAIACALAWTLRQSDWKKRALIAIYCMAAGASFLLMLHFAGAAQYRAASAASLHTYWHSAFPPGNPWKLVLWFVQIHTGNLFAYPVGGKNGASIVTVALFCIGIRRYWKEWTPPIRILLTAPFIFTLIAAAFRLYPYGESARVSQHLAPIIIIIAAAGAGFLIDAAPTPSARIKRLNLAGAVLLAIGVGGIVSTIMWPYKTKADEQLRSDVRSLVLEAGGAPIFVLQPAEATPPTLRWYLHGRDGVVYGADLSGENVGNSAAAYVINCGRSQTGLLPQLAAQSHMNATTWLQDDLQIGPRENGPVRLQIIHLAR